MSEESIRAQISSTESDISRCNDRINELQEEINKLKEVKPVVKEIKGKISKFEFALETRLCTQERWYGNRYLAYAEGAQVDLLDPIWTYYKEVDEILDSINDAIMRRQNEIYRQQGIIGRLKAVLNSLLNALRNLLN